MIEQEVDLAEVTNGVAEIEGVAADGEVQIGEATIHGAIAARQQGRSIGESEGTGAISCVANDIVENDVIGDRAGMGCDRSNSEAAE